MRRAVCLLAALVLLAGCGARRAEEAGPAVPRDSLYVPEAPPKEEPSPPLPPEPPEDPAGFVRVRDYIPEIVVELRYAGEDNFTGGAVYGFSDAYLRYGTVDLTLVDGEGEELEMPSGFDEFSAKADRDYSDVSPAAAENARRLEALMTEAGFEPYPGEWWHYSDTDRYEVEEEFQPPADEEGGVSDG